jgi:hypothetical protein
MQGINYNFLINIKNVIIAYKSIMIKDVSTIDNLNNYLLKIK